MTQIVLIEDNPSAVVPIKATVEEFSDAGHYQFTWFAFASTEEARAHFATLKGPALVMVDLEIIEDGRPNMPAGYHLLKEYAGTVPDIQWMAITSHKMLTQHMIGDKPLSTLLLDLPLFAHWYKDDFKKLKVHLRRFFESIDLNSYVPLSPRFLLNAGASGEFATNDGDLYFQIEAAAKGDGHLVIVGPHGSARLRLAHAIHTSSSRNAEKWGHISARRLPLKSIEADFAQILDRYDGGTVFLDECNALPTDLLENLLQQCLHPSGTGIRLFLGAETSASNPGSPNLPAEFRPVILPPLESRKSDIEMLAARMLMRVAPTKHFLNDRQIFEFLRSAEFEADEHDLERLVDRAATRTPTNLIGYDEVIRAYDEIFTFFGPLLIDGRSKKVMIGNRHIDTIAKQEFELLLYLFQHEDSWCAATDIKAAVWGSEDASDDALQQAVKRLREAVDVHPKVHKYIRSQRNKGYQFKQYDRSGSAP